MVKILRLSRRCSRKWRNIHVTVVIPRTRKISVVSWTKVLEFIPELHISIKVGNVNNTFSRFRCFDRIQLRVCDLKLTYVGLAL